MCSWYLGLEVSRTQPFPRQIADKSDDTDSVHLSSPDPCTGGQIPFTVQLARYHQLPAFCALPSPITPTLFCPAVSVRATSHSHSLPSPSIFSSRNRTPRSGNYLCFVSYNFWDCVSSPSRNTPSTISLNLRFHSIWIIIWFERRNWHTGPHELTRK